MLVKSYPWALRQLPVCFMHRQTEEEHGRQRETDKWLGQRHTHTHTHQTTGETKRLKVSESR